MKKYNKSEIFKAAWKLVKESNHTLSAALKKAWQDAYIAVEMDFSFSEPTTTVAKETSSDDKHYGPAFFKMRNHCFKNNKMNLLSA